MSSLDLGHQGRTCCHFFAGISHCRKLIPVWTRLDEPFSSAQWCVNIGQPKMGRCGSSWVNITVKPQNSRNEVSMICYCLTGISTMSEKSTGKNAFWCFWGIRLLGVQHNQLKYILSRFMSIWNIKYQISYQYITCIYYAYNGFKTMCQLGCTLK